MSLQAGRFYGEPSHNKIPLMSQKNAYYPTGEVMVDPRYSQDYIISEGHHKQRYVAELPVGHQGPPALQNSVRNVSATSYLPTRIPEPVPILHPVQQQPLNYYGDPQGGPQHLIKSGGRGQGGQRSVVATPAATAAIDPASCPKDGLVLMRFYDNKCQCSSCSKLGSCFEQLSMRYRQANFFDADINANGRSLGLLKIDYLPTVIAFRDRKEMGRYFGTDLDRLESFVHEMAHKLF